MMNRHRRLVLSLLAMVLFSWSDVLAVDQVLYGNTYSTSNGFTAGQHPKGSHFHSSNLLVLPEDNPPVDYSGFAEVGGFFGDEEIRGISEFDLPGSAVAQAILFLQVANLFEEGVTFDPNGVDGLFGQGPYEGLIDVFAYAADYHEEVSDYEIAPLSDTPILEIESAPFFIAGGDTFIVDITSIYNDLVKGGNNLGIRLQMAEPNRDAGAITFANFRIELENVPEPGSRTLLLLGVIALLRWRATRPTE